MKKVLNILGFIWQHPLAGRHKVKATWRFFAWQFSQLLSPRLVQYPFVGNTKLWARKGMEAATANIYMGLHEFSDMGFLLHFLRPEDNFADVGANIGAYTILASGVKGARSLSIEPVPATFEALRNNIELNDLSAKVIPLNIGIGNGRKSLFFTDTKKSANHVVYARQQPSTSVEVEVDSLDAITEKAIPALIKIDVEGFEQEVIDGAHRTLADPAVKAVIIELIGGGKRYGFDEDNIRRQLTGHGFAPYTYSPFDRKLSPATENTGNNSLYVRDVEFVKARLKEAPRVKVFSESF